MYKLLVYPYNQGDNCLVEYGNMLENYEIVSLVCLEGAYENGRDAGIAAGIETGIIITDNYENEIDKCDVVLVLDNDFYEHKDTYVEKIRLAISKNKLVKVNKNIYDYCLKFISDSSNINLLDNIPETEMYELMHTKKLTQPDVPVITVMSMGENCSKFEAQLDLRKKFEEKNYKVLQLGTKDYCEVFGFRSLPSFLMKKNISMDKKIYMFNYYINKEVLKDDYDVIILGVSGGILPFNKYVTNHFGEISFIISSALDIDVNMMCFYHKEGLKVDELQEFREYCKGRIGCFTDYFYMSDKQFRISENHDIQYFILDRQYCMNSIPDIDDKVIKFCHTLDERSKEHILNSILYELEENIELV